MPYISIESGKLSIEQKIVLNPSEESFEQIRPLIQEAYEYAKDKYRKRRI